LLLILQPGSSLYPDLKLASHAVLEKAQQRGRVKCSKCGGSRMFFCYTCCSLVGFPNVVENVISGRPLPVKIDIIKHPNETDGKSTAIHAKLLAPGDITIYTYPCIPEFEKDKVSFCFVVLVFPGPGAVSVQDMMQHLYERTDNRPNESSHEPHSRSCPLQRVVFIDSTWNQTNKISTDERLQDLLQVELKMRKTCFWRHQKGKPDTYLATIEAIYYFLKDFHEHCLAQEYNGEYDNLLFFYSYLHSVVNKAKMSVGKH
uniref:tRNA-uridine aminocarboxypropyltransferase 1 n=1 Tax=Monopterus albus TaxID=43700 RepID=A0A3Q3JNB7_MONAL